MLRCIAFVALCVSGCAGRPLTDRPLREDADAREFKAVYRHTGASGEHFETVYVGNGLVRSDARNKDGSELIVIDDHGSHVSVTMVPTLRTAIRWDGLDMLSIPAETFVAGPTGNPCANAPLWWRCEPVGAATVGSFSSHEWSVTDTQKSPPSISRIWVDDASHVIVRYVTGGERATTAELVSIEMGHQPDAVFAIPAGFHVARASRSR